MARVVFRFKKLATDHGSDFLSGFAQDQAEYQLDTKLQTGQPTVGGVIGDATSKFTRSIFSMVPPVTHTKVHAAQYLKTQGISGEQSRALVDRKLKTLTPSTFSILQNKLNLSPTELIDIKKDIKYLPDLPAPQKQSSNRD